MKSVTKTTQVSKSKWIAITALFTAMVFAVTLYIQVPIPLGYFNIGNSFILTFCTFLPAPIGIVAAAFGSGLADLLSYPVYVIPTVIIKSLMPFVFYQLMKLPISSEAGKKVFAMAVATLIPLFGYTLTGMLFYGGFYAGLAQFPGLFIEYIANIILFIVLSSAANQVNFKRMILD